MCRRVECRECGRPSFAGCGAHVEQVLGDVPPAERCRCAEARTAAHTTRDEPRDAGSAARREKGARPWYRTLLGG